ncbi:MAG: MFS transporter [Elusimicrobiaceae bacterium]|nr:MFS transporter [Elusimicrobiaceae bacterium]
MNTRRIFGVLFLLNLFNYVDRQVLYAVFPLLQTDLHLTDLQLGALASAFILVYLCYAPVAGLLADRFARPKLISFSALVWSLATLASGAAKNFSHLLAARGFIGVGEGGFTTMAQPFLAEHYPKEKHARVLALFGLALPLGSALGYALGGILGQAWGWRLAFMVVGVPGVFLALAAWFLPDAARLPKTASELPRLTDYIQLFRNKPFLYVCLVQTVVTFVMGGFSAWAPTYLVRYLHVTAAQAGTWFGGLVIVCGAAGTFLGGELAQRRSQKSPRAYYEVMALSLAGCVLPLWLGLAASHVCAALIFFGLAVLFLFLPTGAIAAALVDTTPAAVRATAFAVNICIIHLLGDALSPTLLGLLSDYWNLKGAFLLGTLVILPGLFFCYQAGKK